MRMIENLGAQICKVWGGKEESTNESQKMHLERKKGNQGGCINVNKDLGSFQRVGVVRAWEMRPEAELGM